MNNNESVTFNYTGNIQSWTVPNTGIYKFDVYGAQGGNIYGSWPEGDLNQSGGKGGYAVGYKKLKKGDILYLGVGSQPTTTTKDIIWNGGSTRTTVAGGYNGGGNGGGYNTAPSGGGYRIMGAGGGASHIALNTNRGTLANYSSHTSELLIVAGGGAGAFEHWEPDGINYGDGSAGGTGGGGSFGKGGNWVNYRGGGGGGYAGGLTASSTANGGTNSITNVPAITIGGTTYSPSSTSGSRTGNGQIKITLIKKSVVLFGTLECDVYWGSTAISSIYTGNTPL